MKSLRSPEKDPSPEFSTEIARYAPLIALAIPHIGHPAVRNRGTIGGSIAFSDPAAELPACLLALGGEGADERIGLGGIAAVILGAVADSIDLESALYVTAVAPVLAVLLTLLLPSSREQRRLEPELVVP